MPNDSVSAETSRTLYPLDVDRVDEYLDDKRVIGVRLLSLFSLISSTIMSSSSSSSSSSPTSTTYPSSSLLSTPEPSSLSLSSFTSAPLCSSSSFSHSSSPSYSYDADSCCQYDPLIQPALIKHEIVPTEKSRQTIAKGRFEASRVIAGQDDRVLVIVGPCSIHSSEQAMHYARLLKEKIPTWQNLVIVMRSYLCVP